MDESHECPTISNPFETISLLLHFSSVLRAGKNMKMSKILALSRLLQEKLEIDQIHNTNHIILYILNAGDNNFMINSPMF